MLITQPYEVMQEAADQQAPLSSRSSGARIRVLLADDHPVLLDSLAFYLSQHPALEVIASVNHADQIPPALKLHQPDVLVMDLSMPGEDAYARLAHVRRHNEMVAVLILTSDLGGYHLPELLRHGARGYLPKDADGKQLVAAISALADGGMYLHTTAQQMLNPSVEDSKHPNLSKRELQLLNLMARGCSNKEIGAQLFLSIGTIKSYSSRLFEKLGVRDRTQAVLYAIQHAILPKQA